MTTDTRLPHAASICLSEATNCIEEYPDLHESIMTMLDAMHGSLGDVVGWKTRSDYPDLAQQLIVLEDAYFSQVPQKQVLRELQFVTHYRMPLGEDFFGNVACIHCSDLKNVKRHWICTSLFQALAPICEQCFDHMPQHEMNGACNRDAIVMSYDFRCWAKHRMAIANHWFQVQQEVAPLPF